MTERYASDESLFLCCEAICCSTWIALWGRGFPHCDLPSRRPASRIRSSSASFVDIYRPIP